MHQNILPSDEALYADTKVGSLHSFSLHDFLSISTGMWTVQDLIVVQRHKHLRRTTCEWLSNWRSRPELSQSWLEGRSLHWLAFQAPYSLPRQENTWSRPSIDRVLGRGTQHTGEVLQAWESTWMHSRWWWSRQHACMHPVCLDALYEFLHRSVHRRVSQSRFRHRVK